MSSQISSFSIFCFFNILFINLALAKNEYDMTIDEYITHINSPAVHKFQLENGRTVLCIRYEDQVSLRVHPEWAVNKTNLNSKQKNVYQNSNSAVGSRIEGCPEGTLPRLEITYEEVNATGSVRNYLRRDKFSLPEQTSSLNNTQGPSKPEVSAYMNAALLWKPKNSSIVLAHGKFNVWNPTIQQPDGLYSLAQIKFSTDTDPSTRVELTQTIEVGWHVYPYFYGEEVNVSRPHLFVYWTYDDYETTGCYNTLCSGYVQLDTAHIQPGDPLLYSEDDGDQKEIHKTIIQENIEKITAYVLYVDNVQTGYWPTSLFGTLLMGKAARQVLMGGEVAWVVASNPPPRGTHMGSGKIPMLGYGQAAYVRQIDIRDNEGRIVSHDPYIELKDTVEFYNIYESWLNAMNDFWYVNFFYGGPHIS